MIRLSILYPLFSILSLSPPLEWPAPLHVGLTAMPIQKPAPQDDSNKRKIIAVAVLIGVAAGAYLLNRKVLNPPVETTPVQVGTEGVFAPGPTSEKVVSKPVESRGVFAAEQALQLIGNSGTVAIVTEIPDPKNPPMPDMARFINLIAVEADAFKNHLKTLGKFTITEELKIPRPDGGMRTEWKPGQFLSFVHKQSPATTIVAFAFLPETLTETEKQALRSRTGKLILVAGSVPEVKPYIDQRLAHLAVASKIPVPAYTGTETETPGQWVRRVHTVLKPQ